MTTLTGWLTIINLFIIVGGGIGGYFAIRSALAKSEAATQERVRGALHDENELLQSRVERLEKENKRLGKLFQAVITTLKKTHGIDLDVDGDIITIRSQNGRHTSRVSIEP